MKQLPSTVVGLLDELDGEYPHKCPKPGEDPERMWMYAGKRELIDLLLSRSSGKKPIDLNKGGTFLNHVHV